jgi:hypothetical protein
MGTHRERQGVAHRSSREVSLVATGGSKP